MLKIYDKVYLEFHKNPAIKSNKDSRATIEAGIATQWFIQKFKAGNLPSLDYKLSKLYEKIEPEIDEIKTHINKEDYVSAEDKLEDMLSNHIYSNIGILKQDKNKNIFNIINELQDKIENNKENISKLTGTENIKTDRSNAAHYDKEQDKEYIDAMQEMYNKINDQKPKP